MRGAKALAAALLAGCVHPMVPPDRNTGRDGESTGAKRIEIVDGVGEARGKVAYGRGDRVDWKQFEITEESDVDVSLRWKGEHRDDGLGFVVYDADGNELAHRRKIRPGYHRLGKSLERVRGTFYVLIYAKDRSDAAKYHLEIEVTPVERGIRATRAQFEAAWVIAGDPPPLGAMPMTEDCSEPTCKAMYPPCDLSYVEPSNPNCEGVPYDAAELCMRPGVHCNPPPPWPEER